MKFPNLRIFSQLLSAANIALFSAATGSDIGGGSSKGGGDDTVYAAIVRLIGQIFRRSKRYLRKVCHVTYLTTRHLIMNKHVLKMKKMEKNFIAEVCLIHEKKTRKAANQREQQTQVQTRQHDHFITDRRTDGGRRFVYFSVYFFVDKLLTFTCTRKHNEKVVCFQMKKKWKRRK